MFKSPKNRSFEYKPWYYDEQKERKEELEKMAEEYHSGNISDERRIQRLRENLNRQWGKGAKSVSGKDSLARTIRLFSVLLVLCGLVWVLFNWF